MALDEASDNNCSWWMFETAEVDTLGFYLAFCGKEDDIAVQFKGRAMFPVHMRRILNVGVAS